MVVAGTIAGVIWWLNARQYATTDDAYIDARTVPISAQLVGKIVAIPVTDNELVEAGAPLVRIDPRDYKAAVAQAQAQLEQAKASVANVEAQVAAQQSKIAQATTQVTQANAALTYAQQQNTRAQSLLQRGAGTEQQAQQTSSQLTQNRAAYAAAKASKTVAEKQLSVLRSQRQSAAAQVDAAHAALEKAQVDPVIEAPEKGRIANLSAAVGAYAQPGQALMALVPQQVWVTANFKETTLADMHVGDEVTISVDAYPGKTFRGHVASIQAGSGTAFSLLPPCGIAWNLQSLIVFRILQGLSGGGMAPSEQSILADTFPPSKRAQAFALYGIAVIIAPTVGPTLGGWITDNCSWHWIFFINIPFGILSHSLVQ